MRTEKRDFVNQVYQEPRSSGQTVLAGHGSQTPDDAVPAGSAHGIQAATWPAAWSWFRPPPLFELLPYGQTANAPVSVIAGEATPSGFCQVRLAPVTASRTVSSYSTSVVAAAKTQ